MSNQNADQSVPLTVEQTEQQRNESAVERLLRESEQSFKPKSVGRCCCNVWSWYICPSPFFTSICDVDHLAAHFFMILLAASVYVAINALIVNSTFYNSATNLQSSFEFWFFIGVGVGIVLCVWGIAQMFALYRGRLRAAQILDANNVLREERFKLDLNISRTNNVRNKLTQTQGRKDEIKDRFKELYSKLRDQQQDLKAVTRINTQIGAVLQDKYLKLLDDIKEELIDSERSVILSIYNNMHLLDGENGLDENEFRTFINKLPNAYQKRFKLEMSNFDRFTKGDGIFHRNDLFDALDQVAEDQAIKTSAA